MTTKKLINTITHALEEMKAQEIVNIDVRKLTSITDNMIICSGTSNRHTKAIADKVISEIKAKGFQALGVEGLETGEWILVDLGDAVVHIMLPQAREFYSIEKLWTTVEKTRRDK